MALDKEKVLCIVEAAKKIVLNKAEIKRAITQEKQARYLQMLESQGTPAEEDFAVEAEKVVLTKEDEDAVLRRTQQKRASANMMAAMTPKERSTSLENEKKWLCRGECARERAIGKGKAEAEAKSEERQESG